ncbi:hypothetical protein [Pseudomonas sp. CGJS7]|uniref:hypothetical protein n=1 Tax=Pseudomonas sp. CGJS7 TaxID=3109348 RepID=UPI00300BAF7A
MNKPVMAHVQVGDREAVAAELHVLLCEAADGGYLAQGIEIDYTATGATEEEAKDHFAKGFTRTVKAYLERNRALEGLFKSRTPAEYIAAYYEGTVRPELCCVVTHRRVEVPAHVPVPHVIAFLKQREQTAAA